MEKVLDVGRSNAEWLNTTYFVPGQRPPNWHPQRAKPNVAATMSYQNGESALKANDGTRIADVNQKARDMALRTTESTDIVKKAMEVAEKIARKPVSLLKAINATMFNSHAEISLMQRVKNSGAAVADEPMVLSVAGSRKVCDHCKECIPAMAEEMKLRFLLVTDEYKKAIYYWYPGVENLKPF